MNRFCPNCGRPMDDFDIGCGPGGMGCIYCTKQCPRCHKEIFDQDTRYDENGQCCKNCYQPSAEEIAQEKARQAEKARRAADFAKNHPYLDLAKDIFTLIFYLAICGGIVALVGWFIFFR